MQIKTKLQIPSYARQNSLSNNTKEPMLAGCRKWVTLHTSGWSLNQSIHSESQMICFLKNQASKQASKQQQQTNSSTL